MISKINFNFLNGINNLSFKGKNDFPALRQKISFNDEGDGFTLETEIQDGIMLQHFNPVITTSQKNFMQRVKALITPDENGTVTLSDKDGNKTVLPRTLTVEEINALKAMGVVNKNEKIKDFIYMVDSGIEIYSALNILTSTKEVIENYKNTTVDGIFRTANDETKLQRPLKEDEACTIFRQSGKKPDGKKLRNFIDLRDNYGLDIKQALAIIKSDVKTQRFYALVTPNPEGEIVLEDKEGNSTTLKRAFKPDEAIAAVELSNSKLKAYQEILDKGVEIIDAAWLSIDDRRSAKFLTLTTPTKDGKGRIPLQDGSFAVLDRALTVNEALIALREHFTNPKIQKQLEKDGKIHSTKRHVGNHIIY